MIRQYIYWFILTYIGHIYIHIRRSTYHILQRSIWNVLRCICMYMYVYAFQGAVYSLDCRSIWLYFLFILADTVTVIGGCMSVYVSICKYFCKNTCIYIKQYMYVFPTVYLTVFLYVFLAVYLAVFLHVFPTVFLAVFFVHIYNRHGAVSAASRSPAPARGLCNLRHAVPTANLSRGSASAGRPLNSIRSGLHDWTAASSGNLYRRALAARWCAMAILVGDRSRGNSGAATSKWRWNDE